ncbi:uncharacterized protein LOC133473361 isoform X2 [Phyllopteryx taeniolatus]|uniref:uncharacterized protein LOC133473361 isoform X2 n=1 Tax=Phyllopteryx taeniolatus TaxID=161469 RepID=UPI002AD459E5|nr:uncharacterized protein LOC133473361 isoform X2 [Phyllopteryx taeniolatus]
MQFVCRANMSADDAVNMGLHFILEHLDSAGTYASILFVDFSSAFNTIIPELLSSKLLQLNVSPAICQWMYSFLMGRTQKEVERLELWCGRHNLELNTLKSVEMIVDFRRHPSPQLPLTLSICLVSTVETFKFLVITVSQDLKWAININSVLKKAQQRMYYLRLLRKHGLPQEMLRQFYTAVIESFLCSSIAV